MATISTIFLYLLRISFLFFLLGLISPTLSLFWLNNTERTRKLSSIIYLTLFFVSVAISALTQTDEQAQEIENERIAFENAEKNKLVLEEKLKDSIRISEIKRKEDSLRNEYNNNDIQMEFLRARVNFNNEYQSAKNDIKKSEIFNNSRKHTCEFAKKYGRSYNNWGGYITTISTDQGGDIVRIVIKTRFDNLVVEFLSTIQRGQKLYTLISELSEGDKVDFSFSFNQELYSSNVMECFDETSLSEFGSLNNPEFSVTFNSVVKD